MNKYKSSGAVCYCAVIVENNIMVMSINMNAVLSITGCWSFKRQHAHKGRWRDLAARRRICGTHKSAYLCWTESLIYSTTDDDTCTTGSYIWSIINTLSFYSHSVHTYWPLNEYNEHTLTEALAITPTYIVFNNFSLMYILISLAKFAF